MKVQCIFSFIYWYPTRSRSGSVVDVTENKIWILDFAIGILNNIAFYLLYDSDLKIFKNQMWNSIANNKRTMLDDKINIKINHIYETNVW